MRLWGRLVLHARARPLGTARVELVITRDGDGSLETLRRLKRIAETGHVKS